VVVPVVALRVVVLRLGMVFVTLEMVLPTETVLVVVVLLVVLRVGMVLMTPEMVLPVETVMFLLSDITVEGWPNVIRNVWHCGRGFRKHAQTREQLSSLLAAYFHRLQRLRQVIHCRSHFTQACWKGCSTHYYLGSQMNDSTSN
jgi:hypothetical protein